MTLNFSVSSLYYIKFQRVPSTIQLIVALRGLLSVFQNFCLTWDMFKFGEKRLVLCIIYLIRSISDSFFSSFLPKLNNVCGKLCGKMITFQPPMKKSYNLYLNHL